MISSNFNRSLGDKLQTRGTGQYVSYVAWICFMFSCFVSGFRNEFGDFLMITIWNQGLWRVGDGIVCWDSVGPMVDPVPPSFSFQGDG